MIELTSAKGDERKQAEKLIGKVELLLSIDDTIFLEADKSYDSKKLRLELLVKDIYPLMVYRENHCHIGN